MQGTGSDLLPPSYHGPLPSHTHVHTCVCILPRPLPLCNIPLHTHVHTFIPSHSHTLTPSHPHTLIGGQPSRTHPPCGPDQSSNPSYATVCVRVCYCVSLSLTSARLSAHPPYLSAGGSSPTDPLPVEVVLASDSLLDSSLTLKALRLFALYNTYRHPYSFQSTLHCKVHLRSLHGYFVCARGSISHELSIKVGKLPTQHGTGLCRTGNY